jgi:hypothetical protein
VTEAGGERGHGKRDATGWPSRASSAARLAVPALLFAPASQPHPPQTQATPAHETND